MYLLQAVTQPVNITKVGCLEIQEYREHAKTASLAFVLKCLNNFTCRTRWLRVIFSLEFKLYLLKKGGMKKVNGTI